MQSNTLVINLFAGPGAGKSTLAAGIFFRIKCLGVNAELAPEYAKDLVWEESLKKLENQIYVFGKQHHRMHRLLGKVDILIADSPLPLSWVYEKLRRELLGISGTDTLKKLILEEFNAMNNINFFLNRMNKYEPTGRTQKNIQEAILVDNRIKQILNEENIPYHEVDVIEQDNEDLLLGKSETIDNIMSRIPKTYLPLWVSQKPNFR